MEYIEEMKLQGGKFFFFSFRRVGKIGQNKIAVFFARNLKKDIKHVM